jgi:hypothetical protein
MQEYIQEIKVFFRIAPHLKDKSFFTKVFWYYLVFISKINANPKNAEHVIRFWVLCSYVMYRIYETLFFFEVLIVFVLLLELSSRFLKRNQFFGKLIYSPDFKTKFGNLLDGVGLKVAKFAAKSLWLILAAEHFAHLAADIASPDTDNGSSLLSKSMDAFTSLDKSRQISDLEHQQEILRQEIDRLRQEIDALRQALLNFLKKS